MGKEELLEEAYDRHYGEDSETDDDQYASIVHLIESGDIKTVEDLNKYM